MLDLFKATHRKYTALGVKRAKDITIAEAIEIENLVKKEKNDIAFLFNSIEDLTASMK